MGAEVEPGGPFDLRNPQGMRRSRGGAEDDSGAAIASLGMFYFVSSMSERQATERYFDAISGVGDAIAATLVQTPHVGAHA